MKQELWDALGSFDHDPLELNPVTMRVGLPPLHSYLTDACTVHCQQHDEKQAVSHRCFCGCSEMPSMLLLPHPTDISAKEQRYDSSDQPLTKKQASARREHQKKQTEPILQILLEWIENNNQVCEHQNSPGAIHCLPCCYGCTWRAKLTAGLFVAEISPPRVTAAVCSSVMAALISDVLWWWWQYCILAAKDCNWEALCSNCILNAFRD